MQNRPGINYCLFHLENGLDILAYRRELFVTLKSYTKLVGKEANDITDRFSSAREIYNIEDLDKYSYSDDVLLNLQENEIHFIFSVEFLPVLLCSDNKKLFKEIMKEGLDNYFMNLRLASKYITNTEYRKGIQDEYE